MAQSAHPPALGAAAGPARRRPARSARRQSSCLLLFLSLIAMLLALVIIVAAGALAVYFYATDRPAQPTALPAAQPTLPPAPTRADYAAIVRREWPWRTVTLDAGFKTWIVPPEQLGLRLDIEATAGQPASEEEATRNPGLLTTSNGDAFFPVWTFDRATAEAALNDLAGEIEIKPQDAGVRIVEARLEATPAQSGRALDVGATLAGMARDPWAVIQAGRLPLVISATRPAIRDTSAALAKAAPWLAAPITLRLYDPLRDEKLRWTIEPQTLASWLSIAPAASAPAALDCAFDQAKVEAYLQTQAIALGQERYLKVEEAAPGLIGAATGTERLTTQRIYHRDRRHTVAAGETLSSLGLVYGIPYPWIQRANPELGDTLRAGQAITIPSTDLLMPVAPIEYKRIIVSLAQQRVQVYENGALKWDWPASTGLDSSPTALGIFQIQSHEENAYASNWNLWMPYFMGVYQPAPEQAFMNGVHGFPSRDNRQILWQSNLGQPVTYGCILVSTANARLLYDWAEDGVIVEIRRQ